MLALVEAMRRVYAQREAEKLVEAILNDLPAQIVFKRMTVRMLPDGKRIGEYHHEPTGVTILYPMLFTKESKK